jgi:hypothetical protein
LRGHIGRRQAVSNLYPGLHLFVVDDQSAYFALTGASTGVWNDIAPVTPSMPDRTKGMSVMLLSDTAPSVRVMVLGGSDSSKNNAYEIIDASSLSSATNWNPSTPFPDGERRSLASAVLLPDGTVFVCGGIQHTNSPCASFDPRTNALSAMSALPSIRDYHSVAFLPPTAGEFDAFVDDLVATFDEFRRSQDGAG